MPARCAISQARHPLLPALLLCLAFAAPAPAHAFWGLLGKAAGKAATAGGKAGTAAKGAAAGAVAAEGTAAVTAGKGAASLADDAAGLGARGGAHELSAVNAALPPEVQALLAKPAHALTPGDTTRMMDSYQQMVAQAGRTGDFSAVEKLPTSAGTSRTLAPPPAKPAAAATPAAEGASGALPLHALRILLHASHAGHRGAQDELARVCSSNSAESRRFPPEVRASAEFRKACEERAAARKGAAAR